MVEGGAMEDDEDDIPPPSRLLICEDDESSGVVGGGRHHHQQQQPEEVASEVIHSLASYCRRRRRRSHPRKDTLEKFDLDDVLTMLTRWDPSTLSSTETITSDDAGGERFEFDCALSILGRILAPPHPSPPSEEVVAPHELVRIAVECQYMTSDRCEEDEEEEEGDGYCESSSIRATPVVSEVSVLCVHLATVGLERALAETRLSLVAPPPPDDGCTGNGDDVQGGRGALPIVPEEEDGGGGGGTKTKSGTTRKNEKKKTIRWRRLASTTGSALELARRALTLPLRESCTRFINVHEDGGDGMWSDEDDHDEDGQEGDGNNVVVRSRSAEREKRKGGDEAAEIMMAMRVTNALLRRLVDASNSILCLVHEHHGDHDGEKKIKVYSVTTHDVAAAGIVTEALDITRTVYFSPPFRDARLVDDGNPPRSAGEDGDVVAMTVVVSDEGGVFRDTDEGRGAIRALSSLILASPLSLNDVLVQPLREDARERQEQREEDEGYLRDVYGDCDLYGDEDRHNISDHRLERFRVDVARRYFDGEVPLHGRGVAVFAHSLLCGDDDDVHEEADGNVLPSGVLSHTCLWRWFYPHASTLLLSDDVGMALDVLMTLNDRVPITASLDCWEVDDCGVDVALDPTSPLGVVGTVQLLINVIMNDNTGGGYGSSSADEGDPQMQSSSYILSLIRSLVVRVGDPARQIECVSILVERCPYPSITPILLDLARLALSSLGRDDASTSGMAGGGGEAGRNAEEEMRGAISALVRLMSPFLDQMREFCGAEEAVVDGRGGEGGSNGSRDLDAEPAADPIALLMENHEAYHACATLLGMPCRSAMSNDVVRDSLRGSVPFRDAVVGLRDFGDALGATLRTWSKESPSSSDGAEGGDNGASSDDRAPPQPPADFFRLYLLDDAVAGMVRVAEEVGVLPTASSDGTGKVL